MDQNDSADVPARSRFFTIMGGICILLGIYVPVSSTIEYIQAWRYIREMENFRQRLPAYLIGHTLLLLFSMLSVFSGWGMWKRRSWAPALACLAGGGILVEVTWWLFTAGPLLLEQLRKLLASSQPMFALSAGFQILQTTVHLVVWLMVLGGVFRQEGRREFPTGRPPFTTRLFFIMTGSGIATVGLSYCFLWLTWFRHAKAG